MATINKSLGRINITAGGTPERVSATSIPCHAYLIQADPANVNPVYIMDRSNGVIATREGVLCILAAPTAASIPSYAPGFSNAANQLNLNEVWIDGTTDEGVIISYLVG